MRLLLAYIVGAVKATAMGDDDYESYVEDAVEKYLKLGYRVKFYERIEGDTFEFCSHLYNRRTRTCYNVNIVKEFMNFAHRTDIKNTLDVNLALIQLTDDLCGNPQFEKLLGVIESVGWYGQFN